MSHDMAAWELIRASGILAYVLLSAAVAIGIAVRVRALDWLLKRAWVYESHQLLSLMALAFTAVHVALLLVNDHVPFSVMEIFVPFAADWRPLASALGSLALYLLVLLTVSSYVRRHIGQKVWRAVHYGGFGAWAAALVHGVSAGTDAAMPWMQYLYLVSGAVFLMLTFFRLIEAGQQRPAPPRRAIAAETPAAHASPAQK